MAAQERALGLFTPAEDRRYDRDRVIDPFRPGLRHPARSDDEFDLLRTRHLRAVLAAFRVATVFVFTLGLTEGWESLLDCAVFPICPGTVAGTFDPQRRRLPQFLGCRGGEDLAEFVDLLWQCDRDVRVVRTVSPVPLVARATEDHVLVATILSKSVLRMAARRPSDSADHRVRYLPAYEIVTGPQAPAGFFAEDPRSVTRRRCASSYASTAGKKSNPTRVLGPLLGLDDVRSSTNRSQEFPLREPRSFHVKVAEAECEEVMVDR